jgi:hypothetical protein
MSKSRLMVVAPVFAGLVVTGSAVARMMPAESVRDSVYQTCAHNGVHFNKQGHANCGLHKGWHVAAPTTPAPPVPITGTAATPATGLGIAPAGRMRPSHLAEPIQAAGRHSGLGHGAKSHGKSSHNKHG